MAEDVTEQPTSKAGRYIRFLGLAFVIVAALCAIGGLPTRRFTGADGLTAMVVGCGISFIAAALAGVLLVAIDAATPEARMQRSALATMARLAAVVVLGVAVALSGEFSQGPLLFWMATAYVALLPLEVMLAIRPA